MKNLTAYNECNEREIEMMVGKAMCAYANWQEVDNIPYLANGCEKAEAKARFESEYEATVRCIDMFVRENIYEIQHHITARAAEELGIEVA